MAPAEPVPLAPERRARLLQLAIWFSLVLGVIIVYGQTLGFDFIVLDDPFFVSHNAHVQEGITISSVKWAFTSQTVLNWIPVTMLSHMLTVQLFGTTGGVHHLMNVVLHLLSAILLLLFLRRATGAVLPSAFVALIYAIHPLHVESVAWVTERKDVLSAVFFFLALFSYVRYTERPSAGRYLLVFVSFALGLMSKPMLVTFPCVLLLLDVWPLRRFDLPQHTRMLVWEKLPLFLLSAGDSLVTYSIAKSERGLQELSIAVKVAVSLISYAAYIKRLFWPARLAAFYPFPTNIPIWQVVFSSILVLCISAVVIKAWRSRPYLAVGWFWYLGMLVPVAGFFQNGYQVRADRYMYLPMVGLLIMLAWGAMDLVGRLPETRVPLLTAAAVSILLCLATAWRQTSYWQNSETLFLHALDVTQDNWMAYGNLGAALMEEPERRGEAVSYLETAIRIRPDYPEAHNNLAVCLSKAGLWEAALPHFDAAMRERGNDPVNNTNYGVCLFKTGRATQALGVLEKALQLDPNNLAARLYLGRTLAQLPGRAAEASTQLEAVLKAYPESAGAHEGLGDALLRLGKKEEALSHWETAQRLESSPEITRKLEGLRSQMPR